MSVTDDFLQQMEAMTHRYRQKANTLADRGNSAGAERCLRAAAALGTASTAVFMAPSIHDTESLEVRYQAYQRACEQENLEAHDFQMWIIHGMPVGPVG